VYHNGGAFHGEQNLGCMIFQVGNEPSASALHLIHRGTFGISPSSKLEWTGVSEQGVKNFNGRKENSF